MIKKTNKQTKANKKTEGIQVIAWLSNNSPKKNSAFPTPAMEGCGDWLCSPFVEYFPILLVCYHTISLENTYLIK